MQKAKEEHKNLIGKITSSPIGGFGGSNKPQLAIHDTNPQLNILLPNSHRKSIKANLQLNLPNFSKNRISINIVETPNGGQAIPTNPNLMIPLANVQSVSSTSNLLDVSNDKTPQTKKQNDQSQLSIKSQQKRGQNSLIAPSPRFQDYFLHEKIDIKNPEHQQIIINILQKNKPKNNMETDILFEVIQNLPFFKSNKELLSLSSTSKELLQSLKLEQYQKNDILFSKGDIGNTFYIIIQGSVYCLLELQKLDQNPKIKEEGSQKKILYNFDLSTNPSFEQEQQALKQVLPNMNMVKIFQPGESFGEIALITSQPRSNAYFMTLTKDAYNKIIGQYDQIILRDRRKFLMNFACFKYHNYSKLLSLLHFMKISTVSKKHVLYKEGDIPEYIYFVKQGEVEISKTSNLDEELLKDTSVELNEWRSQRQTQIYKLNKVKQIKDKIESVLRIQVVILGCNNCFGEEDIFLDQPVRTSSAIVVSSSAEIFCIEKQKLLNELNIYQTLDAFEKEFHFKFKQQQINHQKNIQAALVQRKAQILKNLAKANTQQQNNTQQPNGITLNTQITSPTSLNQQILSFPKISTKKNMNLMQQTFGMGSSQSHREYKEDQSSNENSSLVSSFQSNQLNKLKTRHPNINHSLNFSETNKQSFTQPTEGSDQQIPIGDHKSKYSQKGKESSIFQNQINDPYYQPEHDLPQISNSAFSFKLIQNAPSFELFKSISQRTVQFPKELQQKHNEVSLLLDKPPNVKNNSESNYNTKESAWSKSQQTIQRNEDANSNSPNEIPPPKNNIIQSKKLKFLNMGLGNKQAQSTIRKESGQKRESLLGQLDNFEKAFQHNQLKLVELNTRSLDLQEISSELLKIYIQKHSQQQVQQSLENIAQSRLLSMSTTLRDSSNNRLYMKYQGIFDQKKKSDKSDSNRQSFAISDSQQSSVPVSQKTKPLSNVESPSLISRRSTNLSVKVPPLKISQSIKDDINLQTPPKFYNTQSGYFQTQQSSPKSTMASYFKSSKKSEHQSESPMTTTMKYKYFKQQVDFLENSEKYIEKIKKSNNQQIKLCDILTQNGDQNDSTPVPANSISKRQAQQAFTESISLLTQEMFKGSASSIKNIKLQRHHSLIMAGQITSPTDSPKSAQLRLSNKTMTLQENAYPGFSRKNSQLGSLSSQRSEEDDIKQEECKQITDSINEAPLQESVSPFLRENDRKLSSFCRNSESISQPQQVNPYIQQKPVLPPLQLSNQQHLQSNSPSCLSPTKINEGFEELKRTPKNPSSSFKIEFIQNNPDPIKAHVTNSNHLGKQKVQQDIELISNIKKGSNPQLAKLLSQIEDMKKEQNKEKQEDIYYLARSISSKEIKQVIEDPHTKQNKLTTEKYVSNLSNLKGDMQHYMKIKELNHQKNALFKQAKLTNKNYTLQQANSLNNSTKNIPLANIFLSVQQKQLVQQKQMNS